MVQDNSGCVTHHTIAIHDRGGERRIAQLSDMSVLRYERALSNTGTASVTFTGRGCRAQSQALAEIEPKRHELVIFRGNDRVWEGPIRGVALSDNQASVTARDVTQYLAGTPLSIDWPGPDEGGEPLMTDRIQQIIEHELTIPYTMTVGTGLAAHPVIVPRWEGIDPPINVLPFLEVRPGTVLTRAETKAFEMSVFEHLRALLRSGVDMTVVGRKLVFWDRANALGRIRTLTESDFIGTPRVVLDGENFSAITHISAQRYGSGFAPADDSGVPEDYAEWGSAGAPDPYYGVWTHIHTAASETGQEQPTQDALNSQSQRIQIGRNPVPVGITLPDGVGFRLSDTLRIQDLVPGVEVPVLARFNLRPMNQVMQLSKLSVTEDNDGEKVQGTLIPAGDAVLV